MALKINFTTKSGIPVENAYAKAYIKDISNGDGKTLANVIFNIFASEQAKISGLPVINPEVSPLQVAIDVNEPVHSQVYTIVKSNASQIAGALSNYDEAITAHELAITESKSESIITGLKTDMDTKHGVYTNLKRFEMFLDAEDVLEA